MGAGGVGAGTARRGRQPWPLSPRACLTPSGVPPSDPGPTGHKEYEHGATSTRAWGGLRHVEHRRGLHAGRAAAPHHLRARPDDDPDDLLLRLRRPRPADRRARQSGAARRYRRPLHAGAETHPRNLADARAAAVPERAGDLRRDHRPLPRPGEGTGRGRGGDALRPGPFRSAGGVPRRQRPARGRRRSRSARLLPGRRLHRSGVHAGTAGRRDRQRLAAGSGRHRPDRRRGRRDIRLLALPLRARRGDDPRQSRGPHRRDRFRPLDQHRPGDAASGQGDRAAQGPRFRQLAHAQRHLQRSGDLGEDRLPLHAAEPPHGGRDGAAGA